MDHAETIVKILDFFWFEQEIFATRAQMTSSSGSDKGTIAELDRETDELLLSGGSKTEEIEIAGVLSILPRSMSEPLGSEASFQSDSPSPNSVLRSPAHLRPVEESGKEVSDDALFCCAMKTEENRGKDDRRRMMRKKMKALSKSLTELEFKELKGFMDLGYVFTPEDKDSSLAKLIPGLQRLGEKDGEEELEQSTGETESDVEESDQEDSPPPPAISRPYLSESWGWLGRRKDQEESPFVDWNFPAMSDEDDMKDNLRWWARAVASIVG